MAKFAIGDKVDKAASLRCFRPPTAIFATPSIWKATARSSFSPRKNWSFTLTDFPTGTDSPALSCPDRR